MMRHARLPEKPGMVGLTPPPSAPPAAPQSDAAPGLGAPTTLDTQMQQVADEQLRQVLTHGRLGGLVAALFAVLIAVKLRQVPEPAFWVDVWLVLKLAISGWRSVLAWRAGPGQGRPHHNQGAIDGWLLIDGALWGALGVVMMQAAAPLAALVAAALVGISSAATFGLQVRFRSTVAYVAPILAPTAASLAGRGDDFGVVGGLGLAMLLAVQLGTARRSAQRLTEGMLLRLQAQALVREKDDALRLALRQSAVKTQFLANISHELRTPLHGILGLARVLLHEQPVPGHEPDESDRALARRRLELIEASGTHLLALINDLLDISRIEAGRFVMRSEPFDVNAQIEQVAAVHALRARDKGLGFEWASTLPEPCWVQGDAARFRQVLHNLLGNAVKFTQHGAVTLNARRVGPDRFEAEVRDSGPGIAPADLPRVFEAFSQSAQAADQAAEGAGLGLTIARDIARQMGGDILARSSLGRGSTLTFSARLPAAEAPAAAAALPPEAPVATAPGPHAKALKVLVAEDDDVNALIILAYLEQLGVRAERVADGAAALPLALKSGGRPDVMLMDCRMPVMDGYSATRAIREQEAAQGWARMPIIALTATAGDADRQTCLDAGMDDFLAKPYTRAELAAVLAHSMASRRFEAGAVSSASAGG